MLLAGRTDVLEFLKLYGDYCELVDDLVDEPKNPELIDKAGRIRMQIDLCEYWTTHKQYLWVVERLIHNTYFDTVKWENAKEEWKRRDARALSHCAYNMLFAVILIELGDEKLAEISLRFREHAHLRHINDPV